MPYTVKELAKLSGVSIRTLHWYDEIGLLKPAYYGTNNYRYYEEEELLQLQQILFFRELGFKLDDIQKALSGDHFDKVKALKAHKRTLEKNLDQTQQLIETIDKTILRLRGKKLMEDKELYTGFDPKKQKEYEEYIVEYGGTVAEQLLEESRVRTAEWGTKKWNEVKEEGNQIYAALSKCIENELAPDSTEVQKLIQQHVIMTEYFYDVSKDVYVGLSQLYCEHPDFRKHFDKHHPKLANFIAEAMRVYAHRELS